MNWIHIVGAGGIAMSAIANCFIEQGIKVTGSDLQENNQVKNLRDKGAEITIGHQAENINRVVDKVIYSDAIPEDNVELQEARRYGIDLLGRSAALDLLTAEKQVISAAGTHGKTTTSSLIAYLLDHGGLKPSFIIGGMVNNFSSNYNINQQGDYFVLEGDEYGRSFLKYTSNLGVVTNVEFDHPDIYEDLADLIDAYRKYIAGLDQLLVTNQQVLDLLEIAPKKLTAEVVTVGINDSSAQYNAVDIYSEELISYFTLEYKGREVGQFQISALGDYNVKHALEAIAVGHYCGLSFAELQTALPGWEGVKRRFEIIHRTEDRIVISDYAHHPQELKVVVDNLDKIKTNKDKVVIFQPHQYLRTKRLFADYEDILDFDIDKFIVYQIYKVREQVSQEELEGLGEELSNIISPHEVQYINNWGQLKTELDSYTGNEGAIYLFLGAGDIDQFARSWAEK